MTVPRRLAAGCLAGLLGPGVAWAQPAARAATPTAPVARAETPASAPSPSPSPAANTRPHRPRAARPQGPPDLYYLLDGDRVSGQTLSRSARAFVVLTAYGRLTLPRAAVQRVARADGTEEVLAPPVLSTPAPTASPALPRPWTLTLVLSGQTFWQAWEPRASGVRPDLRLVVRLGENDLASYEDRQLDPEDLPGATVNTFSFDPAHVVVTVAAGITAQAPEVRPGRITLRLAVPVGPASEARRLRVAYQAVASAPPDATGAPVWQDLIATAATLPEEPAVQVEIAQNSGRMEYSGFRHKRMKNVDSFRLDVRVSTPEATHLDSPRTRP